MSDIVNILCSKIGYIFCSTAQNSKKNKFELKFVNFDAILRQLLVEIRYNTQ